MAWFKPLNSGVYFLLTEPGRTAGGREEQSVEYDKKCVILAQRTASLMDVRWFQGYVNIVHIK